MPPAEEDEPSKCRNSNSPRQPPATRLVTPGRKRTIAITLVAMGAGAVAIYGLSAKRDCKDEQGAQDSCSQSGSSSHGGGGSSGGSKTSNASETTSRGGFGGTGEGHAGSGG